MLAERQVQRGAQARRGRRRIARVLVRELLGHRGGERIADHLHVAARGAERGERQGLVARGLRVDHRLERQHVMLDEIGDDVLREIRVGRAEERAEVLRVRDQVGHRLVLLGLVLGGEAGRVVHDEADVLPPQRQERVLGGLAVDGAERDGDVLRVGVQRIGGGLELGRAAAEGGIGRRGGEIDVLGEERVPSGAQVGRALAAVRGHGGDARGREQRDQGEDSGDGGQLPFHVWLLFGWVLSRFERASGHADLAAHRVCAARRSRGRCRTPRPRRWPWRPCRRAARRSGRRASRASPRSPYA